MWKFVFWFHLLNEAWNGPEKWWRSPETISRDRHHFWGYNLPEMVLEKFRYNLPEIVPAFEGTISNRDRHVFYNGRSPWRLYLQNWGTISLEMVQKWGTISMAIVPELFKCNLLEMVLIICKCNLWEMVPQFFKYNLRGRIMGDGTPISQVQSLGDGTYILLV